MVDTEQITIRTYAPGTDTPQLVDTRQETVTLAPEEIERRALVVGWKTRRDALIAANQTLQDATTTAQVTAAVKAYATANVQAFAVVQRAVKWLDTQLAAMDEA